MNTPSRASGSRGSNRGDRLARLLPWGGRGAASILDQGLFAVSNFVMSILLARWLQPTDYGTFAVAYSLFALLATLHTGFLGEPLLVYGSRRYEQRRDRYLGTVVRGHWFFAGGLCLIVLLVGSVWSSVSRPTAFAILALAVAAPFMLYRQLGRMASYMILRPRFAAIAAAIYMILMLPGILLAQRAGWLSSGTAFGLMGIASLTSGFWLFTRLRLTRVPLRGNPMLREILRDHWRYGKWAAATGMLTWIPTQIYYFMLPVLISLDATAELKAVTNLIMPALHTFTAIGTLLTPALVRIRDRDYFRRALLAGMAVFLALAVAYWIVLGVFYEPIFRWLYAGQYTTNDRLPWIIGLVPIVAGSVTWLASALRALERPAAVFWSYAMSSAGTVTIGFGLMIWLDLEGAVWGMVAASTITALVMFWFLFIKRIGIGENSVGTHAP